ncbi:MAG: hypothetical protein ACHQ0Y_04845 [Thermodesulfovibrionales bacterium]
MGTDEKGYINGIYKDIDPAMGPVDMRAGLLRVVSKRLIRASIGEDLRREIILDLCQEFGIELSDQGIWHFLNP